MPRQIVDAPKESMKTRRSVSFPSQMPAHAASTRNLLEFGNELADFRRWIDDRIRVAIWRFVAYPSQPLLVKRFRQSVRFAEVPGLQLLAGEADQRIPPATRFAQLEEPCFQPSAVLAIVVPDHTEKHTRLAPGPQLARDALLQVLLALVGYALERQSRKQPRQQDVQQVPH